MPFVRTPYNYDPDVVSFKSGLDCSDDPSRAQQNMKDETDINVLIARFGINQVAVNPVDLQDVYLEENFDFQKSMNAIVAAQQAFDRLPAKLRERFGNDAHKFVQFVENEDNRAEAEFLGLVATPPPPQPQTPPVASSGSSDEPPPSPKPQA